MQFESSLEMRSNKSLERTRGRYSAKPKLPQARRSAQPLGIKERGMSRLVLAFILASVSLSARADEFYIAVHVECSKASDYVAVDYMGAYNEKGKAMMERLGEKGIDPWKLVTITDDRVSEMNTVKRECSLSDGDYVVEIGPSPGNGNIQGRCGAQMSAWARIYKEDAQLFYSPFEGDCFSQRPVLTRVLWRAGAAKAETTETPHDEFYK
jgi:hypothetical protein